MSHKKRKQIGKVMEKGCILDAFDKDEQGGLKERDLLRFLLPPPGPMEKIEPITLPDLPEKVWTHIFEFANNDVELLKSARLVCRAWNVVIVPILRRLSCVALFEHHDDEERKNSFFAFLSYRGYLVDAGIINWTHPFRDFMIYVSKVEMPAPPVNDDWWSDPDPDMFNKKKEPVVLDPAYFRKGLAVMVQLPTYRLVSIRIHSQDLWGCLRKVDYRLRFQLLDDTVQMTLEEVNIRSEKDINVTFKFIREFTNLKRLCFRRLCANALNVGLFEKLIHSLSTLSFLEELSIKFVFPDPLDGNPIVEENDPRIRRSIMEIMRVALPSVKVDCTGNGWRVVGDELDSDLLEKRDEEEFASAFSSFTDPGMIEDESRFRNVPPQIWAQILRRVSDIRTLKNCRLVCKLWDSLSIIILRNMSWVAITSTESVKDCEHHTGAGTFLVSKLDVLHRGCMDQFFQVLAFRALFPKVVQEESKKTLSPSRKPSFDHPFLQFRLSVAPRTKKTLPESMCGLLKLPFVRVVGLRAVGWKIDWQVYLSDYSLVHDIERFQDKLTDVTRLHVGYEVLPDEEELTRMFDVLASFTNLKSLLIFCYLQLYTVETIDELETKLVAGFRRMTQLMELTFDFVLTNAREENDQEKEALVRVTTRVIEGLPKVKATRAIRLSKTYRSHFGERDRGGGGDDGWF